MVRVGHRYQRMMEDLFSKLAGCSSPLALGAPNLVRFPQMPVGWSLYSFRSGVRGAVGRSEERLTMPANCDLKPLSVPAQSPHHCQLSSTTDVRSVATTASCKSMMSPNLASSQTTALDEGKSLPWPSSRRSRSNHEICCSSPPSQSCNVDVKSEEDAIQGLASR
eukprot:CAMPEP_0196749784 /NCGR_PEP_ID=MMETSP1091-20130531/78270_1 /TAXON_ID=302021 /ORGANISM="Rhodomonas sp., Strain CCMP768" /LENGTH=164 /DNA_ID=CAMNT_0042097317 /DNA_START=104 /DNA_END=598 /DNA_ORIENTATION=+